MAKDYSSTDFDNFDLGENYVKPSHEGQPRPEQDNQYHFLTEHEVMIMEPPMFLIEGLLVKNTTTLLYAVQRSLKTFLTLDIALSITYGIPFHGRQTTKGAVVYICGEGLAGIGKRIHGWRQHHNINKTQQSPMLILNRAIRLLDEQDITGLIEILKTMEAQNDFKIELVVVDTVSKSLFGAKEDEEGIGRALMSADRIQKELTSHVLLVHHEGKGEGKGARGSSLFGCNADAVYKIKRIDDTIYLTAEKMKDVEDGFILSFRANKVELPERNGTAQDTLVLEYLGEVNAEEDAEARRKTEQHKKDVVKQTKVNEKEEELRRLIASALTAGHHTMLDAANKIGKGKGRIYAEIRAAVTMEWSWVSTPRGVVKLKRDMSNGEMLIIEG